ncbi:hypothetical protein [Streptomyces antarcticus]|uniref:hypothetical protein n=1 Tax=Streptomyces antarcticus TaxID=2996458 RepID=UPI00226FFF66|nr:hypothetical protein [Streptomyces sp. H34-AA3]MCY0947075.1 hypothetical protein [Streptomyces sp. H34-AA3]
MNDQGLQDADPTHSSAGVDPNPKPQSAKQTESPPPLQEESEHQMATLWSGIQQWLSRWGDDARRGSDERVRELNEKIDTLSKELTDRLEEALAVTERRFDQQQKNVDLIRENLDLLRAMGVETRTDLTLGAFLPHQRFAARLDTLYSQRLQLLIGPRTTAEHPPNTLLREAQLVQQMCLTLFGSDGRDPRNGPDLTRLNRIVTSDGEVELSPQHLRLLNRVGREATDLCRAIADTGHPTQFIFEVEPGTVADPKKHRIPPPSEAGRPVAFVMCPGYQVADRPMLLPTVFTEPRDMG